MGIFRSDDPVADFNRHEANERAWLAKRPICEYCREHIQNRKLIDYDGVLYHRSCFLEQFEKETEDYIE